MTGDDDQYEDEALWAAATQDVKRMPGKKKPRGDKKRVVHVREARPAAGAKIAKTGKGIDTRTDKKLKRGQLEIEARLDLHGFRQKEARAEVIKKLTRWHAQGKRCVLVITGKGSPRNKSDEWWDEQPALLRETVPRWLKEPPLSEIVLQCHPAAQKDGGGGAFYVLLRRAR